MVHGSMVHGSMVHGSMVHGSMVHGSMVSWFDGFMARWFHGSMVSWLSLLRKLMEANKICPPPDPPPVGGQYPAKLRQNVVVNYPCNLRLNKSPYFGNQLLLLIVPRWRGLGVESKYCFAFSLQMGLSGVDSWLDGFMARWFHGSMVSWLSTLFINGALCSSTYCWPTKPSNNRTIKPSNNETIEP